MVGVLIAVGLGAYGKWRWLGYVYLLAVVLDATTGMVRGGGDLDILILLLAPVAQIAAGYGIGVLWHRWRRGKWPTDKAIAKLSTIRRAIDGDGQESICWEVESAALTPQVLRVFAVALVLVFALITVVFALIGGDILRAVDIAAIGTGVLVALFAFVVFALLFNRLRRAYVFTDDYYAVTVSDPRLFAGAFASSAVGAAACRPGMAGAGMAAVAQRGERHSWDSIAAADYDPAHARISITFDKGGWLGHDRIQCHPEGYPAASAWVARHVGHAGSAGTLRHGHGMSEPLDV